MLFEDVLTTYLDFLKIENRSSDRDRYTIKKLLPYFQGRCSTSLRRIDLRQYIAHRQSQGVQLSTVRRELRLFSAAFNFVRLEHDRPDIINPAAGLRIPQPEGRVRWITREEAARLIRASEEFAKRPHLPCFIRLALNTGCRKGELLNLEWSRVQATYLLFEARHTKSRKRKTVPLNDDAVKTLEQLRKWQQNRLINTSWVFGREDGQPLTTFKTGFTGSCARAGIEDFRIHDLRHTFASWLVMQGESLYVVKELLGHSSITVTERYAHLAPHQTAQAVQRLLPF